MTKLKKVTVKDLKNTRAGKYLVARSKGLPKAESARVAGYTENTALHNTDKIEATQVYQALDKKFFRDELSAQITMQEIGEELVKNIKQDMNLGAKNQAIQMALDKLEPDDVGGESDDKILVILG